MNEHDADDELVCHCIRVTRRRVLEAIREHGARSVADLNRLTGACGGCQSCRWDLEDLIRAEGIALPEDEPH